MKFDLHTHHDRCGHATGEIRQYIETALAHGLSVVGISDHSPYFASDVDQLHPQVAMAKSEFPNYIAEVLCLKQEYEGKIDVLLGVESDFFPESSAIYAQEYAKYPFDYIIGSVHLSDGVSIFNRNRWTKLNDVQKVAQAELYFDAIQQSARSGMFQILGHIDAMKANYPEFSNIAASNINQTLKIIGESEVAIEVNTSGKTKDVGGWYPSDAILEKALYYGVEATFGSDSHIPERIGDDWELVSKRLNEIGFKQWVYYKNKTKMVVPL